MSSLQVHPGQSEDTSYSEFDDPQAMGRNNPLHASTLTLLLDDNPSEKAKAKLKTNAVVSAMFSDTSCNSFRNSTFQQNFLDWLFEQCHKSPIFCFLQSNVL